MARGLARSPIREERRMSGENGSGNADLVFLNGRVITVNPHDEIAEAVAVVGNRIALVGTNESVKALVGNETRVLDLAGRALTPGFVENHMHMPSTAGNARHVDCSPAAVASISELVSRVGKR